MKPSCLEQATMPSFWALPPAGIRRKKMTASTFALIFIFHLPIHIGCNSIPAQRMVGGNGPLGQWYIKRYESRMGTDAGAPAQAPWTARRCLQCRDTCGMLPRVGERNLDEKENDSGDCFAGAGCCNGPRTSSRRAGGTRHGDSRRSAD